MDRKCWGIIRGPDTKPLPLPSEPDIPEELLMSVFSWLDYNDLCSVARVCTHWNALADDNQLWKQIFLKHFFYHLPLDPQINWKESFIKQTTPPSWCANRSDKFRIMNIRGHRPDGILDRYLYGPIHSIYFDGSLLLSGGVGEVALWDLHGSCLAQIDVRVPNKPLPRIRSVAFNQSFIYASYSRQLRVWDRTEPLGEGRCLASFEKKMRLGQLGKIFFVTFSSRGLINVFIQNGTEIEKLVEMTHNRKQHGVRLRNVFLSEAREQVVSVASDGDICVFDMCTGKLLRRYYCFQATPFTLEAGKWIKISMFSYSDSGILAYLFTLPTTERSQMKKYYVGIYDLNRDQVLVSGDSAIYDFYEYDVQKLVVMGSLKHIYVMVAVNNQLSVWKVDENKHLEQHLLLEVDGISMFDQVTYLEQQQKYLLVGSSGGDITVLQERENDKCAIA